MATKRLLLADDAAKYRRALRERLDGEPDLEVVGEAENGRDAVYRVQELEPDVILMDLVMPEMDGVEVLQKAIEEIPDLDVVMMTAYATVETAVEAMRIGARDYLVKPFDPETLIPMVERLYQEMVAAEGRQIEVGAVVLCGGTAFFDPATGKLEHLDPVDDHPADQQHDHRRDAVERVQLTDILIREPEIRLEHVGDGGDRVVDVVVGEHRQADDDQHHPAVHR